MVSSFAGSVCIPSHGSGNISVIGWRSFFSNWMQVATHTAHRSRSHAFRMRKVSMSDQPSHA